MSVLTINMTCDEWNNLSKDILESKSGFEKAMYNFTKEKLPLYNIIMQNGYYPKLFMYINFPEILTSNQRHIIHKYSKANEINTSSYDNTQGTRIVCITLFKKYINMIYNKYSSCDTNDADDINSNNNETLDLTNTPQIPIPIPNLNSNPNSISNMEEVINVLNKQYIALCKPYTLSEVIANLEKNIATYSKDLEILKSIESIYGEKSALDISKNVITH